MSAIAIMQGRLSPASDERLQFFPAQWSAEFPAAKKMGFDAITWFLDRDYPALDPIRDVWEDRKMLEQIDRARAVLPISSVDCGTYAWFGADAQKTVNEFDVFLPAIAPRLSTGILVIPLLEKNAPQTESEKSDARRTISAIASVAQQHGLRLALETEMPAGELADFVDSFESPVIGICYDIGNCTSYGFDCPADIASLGPRILEVHLKDRHVGSSQSVLLGEGDADFDACFRALKGIHYAGAYTLQAWRGNDYLADAARQLAFIREKLQYL